MLSLSHGREPLFGRRALVRWLIEIAKVVIQRPSGSLSFNPNLDANGEQGIIDEFYTSVGQARDA